VSHHLDYKGDWDVPEGLKQALSALGGLFFVADNQFEQFYAARIQSELEAAKGSDTDEDQEINLDTMKSYLERKLPTHGRGSSTAISSLVKEVKKAGYQSMNDIDRDMDRGKLAFEAYEPKHPPDSGRYVDVGEVRGTLRIVSESMRDVARASREGRLVSDLFKEYEDFCHLVRPE
jgi:putative GTP pyrophosphokinase